ncbi:hypothetical protein [Amycolatopsis cihanbeyliensis]|uniref:Secreted protein n=1 Tax=Amycolatopsis cihanbeyliensis TaxID=1128664 RepID=A0A542DPB8_AMYCI|nr:hypothetical protein [Amycolatopsis cihanbeyliensis]TQJ04815.1 hypothetical protein FB471_4624 [Amycolatopsis cihanbeyliensis]
MRGVQVAVAGTLLALLAGCGSEAGPTPERPAPDPGPGALRVKLEALAVDQCYLAPTEQDPPGCEKYVTQLGSIPGAAEKYAGEAHPDLAEHGRELERGIQDYRAHACYTAGGADEPECPKALADMATALHEVQRSLGDLLGAGTTAG